MTLEAAVQLPDILRLFGQQDFIYQEKTREF